MQIAQELAGYTLGAADILRRAMGKKKPAEMAKQRIIFVEGSMERGVDEDVANLIFDQMETFAGYGFNKSHSAAYALIAYQTAWLKAHYQAAFMAAVLSSDMDNTDKVDEFIHECRDLGLQDIAAGHQQFTPCLHGAGRHHHPLRAGRAERRGPCGHRYHRERPGSQRAFQRPVRFLQPDGPPQG